MSASGKITKIPLAGGSGQIPTGAMQFENDWPGLFLRGDDAIALMGELDEILAFAREKKASVITWKIREIREIIANDVIGKKA